MDNRIRKYFWVLYVLVAIIVSLVVGRGMVYWLSARVMSGLNQRTLGKKGVISSVLAKTLSYIQTPSQLYIKHLSCKDCSVNPPNLAQPADPALGGELSDNSAKSKLPLSICGGLMMSHIPEKSVAILLDKRPFNPVTYQVRKGYRLTDFDATVDRIEDDKKVWLRFSDGHQEYLEVGSVPLVLPPPLNGAGAKNSNLVQEFKDGVKCKPDGYSCEVNASLFKKLLNDSSQVLTGAFVKGFKDGNGNPVGLAFNALSSSSFFYVLGLRKGDVLTQINGLPTTNEGEAMTTFGKLTQGDTPSRFNVAVLRNGQLVSFDFQVK